MKTKRKSKKQANPNPPLKIIVYVKCVYNGMKDENKFWLHLNGLVIDGEKYWKEITIDEYETIFHAYDWEIDSEDFLKDAKLSITTYKTIN